MVLTLRMPAASRLPSLTGLRFLAAMLVFLYHGSLMKIVVFNPFADAQWANTYNHLFNVGGRVGVSFFFVLSGFVLTWSARSSDTTPAFLKRRLLKIYPNHIVTWAVAMMLLVAPGTRPAVWLPNLFLLHAWVPEDDILRGVNAVSWSLCSELLFYMLFPLILPAVKRIRAARLWWWAAGTVAALLAAQGLITLLTSDAPVAPGWPLPELRFWLAYFFPPLRLFEFVLGMLMARILMTGQWIRLGLLPAFLFMVLGYAAARVVPFQYSLNAVIIVPIALLITAVAATDVAGAPTLLASRTMVWLGEVSFAFYMVHLEVLYGARALLHGQAFATPVALGVIAVEFGTALLLAWMLYALVERPIMRRWAGNARPRPARALVGRADDGSRA